MWAVLAERLFSAKVIFDRGYRLKGSFGIIECSEVKLLTDPTNFAVIHLPHRKYSGVVFQGDNLNILLGDLDRIKQLAIRTNNVEVASEMQFLVADMIAVRRRYEAVCTAAGIDLPY
jgi:hypothetical protein